MPNSDDLIFLDFEASSLRPHSFPIEAGWAVLSPDGSISVDSRLIKPDPSWDDWDPEAEKVHGISMAHLYGHGLPAASVIDDLAAALAGKTVYSDSERDKLWCRTLFDVAKRGNPFYWKHMDALWVSPDGVTSDIAFEVATRLVERTGPVPHRAGPDAAWLAATYAIARAIDAEIATVEPGRGDRSAGFAEAEKIGKRLIERYLPLLVHPERVPASPSLVMTHGLGA